MAKSGTFYTNVGKHWRLQGEWKATQSIENNTSTITLKTYWIALDKWGAIYSYVKKTAKSWIGGTVKTNYLPNAALNPNQKKLINTQTLTVKHNADGTHDGITLKVYFGMGVCLSDVWYWERTASKKVTLDTIPRKSSITSKADFTAGKNLAVTIGRKASAHTHSVFLYVNGTLVATEKNVATKVTLKPDHTKVFNALDKDNTKKTKLSIETYNAKGKSMGTTSIEGTCTAPTASTLKSSANFTTGNSVTIQINRVNSRFTHTVRLIVGSWEKSWQNVGTSVTWTPTASETEAIQNQIKKANTGSCLWRVATYYNGEQVRYATEKSGTVTVNSSNRNPVVSTSGCYAYDSVASIVEVTGSNRIIIQNKSNVKIYIPANPITIRRNANFNKYTVSCNGKVATYSNQSAHTMDVGKISKSGTISATITGYDSRGNKASKAFTFSVRAYSGIKVQANGKRVGGLSETVRFLPAITFDTLGGIQAYSKIKATINNTKATTNLTVVSTGVGKATLKLTSTTAYTDTLDVDETRTYTIIVTDVFNTQNKVTYTIKKGTPNLYIDEDNPQIAVGTFPKYDDSAIEVNGGIVCKSNGYYYTAENTKRDRGYAGVDLNNSDLIGANSMAFNDSCGKGVTDTEGILFPNTDITTDTRNSITGMTKLFAVDGVLYLSDYETNTSRVNPIALADTRTALWTGNAFMMASQSYTISRSIYDCPNGWCLVWSRYADGEAQNDNWCYTYIHKFHTSGGGIGVTVHCANETPQWKYVYVQESGKKLTGHEHNNSNSLLKKITLRYVLAW